MGGTSSKIVRSNQSSPPDTPVLNDSLALTVDDNAKGIITNYAKGCWVGNHHKPLINNLSGTKPFFIIRITRKQISSKDLESLEKSNDGSMIVLWLESKYKSTSILTVCYQSSSEILTMFTMPAPDFETNEPDTTRRQFQCEPLQYGETANFMVYVGNSEYIEGEYALAVRSLNDQYVANLYVPRQYNRKWWNNEELQISTTLIGSWEGFSSYGGAPYSITDNAWLLNNPSCIISTKDTARCWITLTKSYFSEKEAYTSDLCWSDKHEGFGMGLVLLKLKYGETRIVDTKGIDERITGHSIFPINAEANLVDFRAFLVKGRYQIIIFPQEKRCVGKYCLLIKSDTELMSKPLKPNTCLTELGTVWLNNPLPVAIPNLKYQCPTFNLTTKSSTFAIVTLELPSSQYDYEDNFQVNGHLICLENSREIKMWMFHLGMYSNTQHHRETFKIHLKGNKTYTFIPNAKYFTLERDMPFNFGVETLKTAECNLSHGIDNHLFQLRTLKELENPNVQNLLDHAPEHIHIVSTICKVETAGQMNDGNRTSIDEIVASIQEDCSPINEQNALRIAIMDNNHHDQV